MQMQNDGNDGHVMVAVCITSPKSNTGFKPVMEVTKNAVTIGYEDQSTTARALPLDRINELSEIESQHNAKRKKPIGGVPTALLAQPTNKQNDVAENEHDSKEKLPRDVRNRLVRPPPINNVSVEENDHGAKKKNATGSVPRTLSPQFTDKKVNVTENEHDTSKKTRPGDVSKRLVRPPIYNDVSVVDNDHGAKKNNATGGVLRTLPRQFADKKVNDTQGVPRPLPRQITNKKVNVADNDNDTSKKKPNEGVGVPTPLPRNFIAANNEHDSRATCASAPPLEQINDSDVSTPLLGHPTNKINCVHAGIPVSRVSPLPRHSTDNDVYVAKNDTKKKMPIADSPAHGIVKARIEQFKGSQQPSTVTVPMPDSVHVHVPMPDRQRVPSTSNPQHTPSIATPRRYYIKESKKSRISKMMRNCGSFSYSNILRYFALIGAILQTGAGIVIFVGALINVVRGVPYVGFPFLDVLVASPTLPAGSAAGFFLVYFIICGLLCYGLLKRQPWWIAIYIVNGVTALAFRVERYSRTSWHNTKPIIFWHVFLVFILYLLTLLAITIKLSREMYKNYKLYGTLSPPYWHTG